MLGHRCGAATIPAVAPSQSTRHSAGFASGEPGQQSPALQCCETRTEHTVCLPEVQGLGSDTRLGGARVSPSLGLASAAAAHCKTPLVQSLPPCLKLLRRYSSWRHHFPTVAQAGALCGVVSPSSGSHVSNFPIPLLVNVLAVFHNTIFIFRYRNGYSF